MKLPLAARDLLRRILKENPSTLTHCPADRVDHLDKGELLTLAKKVGVDVALVVDRARHEGGWPDAYYEEREAEAIRHTERHPAFTDTSEFEIAFEVMNIGFTRKARIKWTWTPNWPYYDMHKHCVFEAPASGSMEIEIWAVPDELGWYLMPTGNFKKGKGKPAWISANQLLSDGVLPSSVWQRIEDDIEEKCHLEDKERRGVEQSGGD